MMRVMKSLIRRSLLTLLALDSSSHAAQVTVSAAISMKDALTDIGKQFEQSTGDHVSFNFLASGPLMKQIEEGAPVDVFISASHEQMDELQRQGLISPATRQDVADGDLVMVVPAKANIDPPASIADLASPRFQRIAIGDPATVPAGEYAKQSLTSVDLMDRLKDRLKTAINVRQVLEYVEKGEVDVGFVYRTDAVHAGDQVKIAATVPARAHEPIIYPGAVIAKSAQAAEAKRFLEFITSAAGRATLVGYGFTVPHATTQGSK